MSEPRNLLIVGASARAAAQSARRAGFIVTAIDLFADEDLTASARAIRCDDYPRGLIRLTRDAPPSPWMYTGGLENHPNIVAAISAIRPLWGNDAKNLRAVRDPIALYNALSTAGLPAIEVRRDIREVPRDGSWLAKPVAGSGGLRVHVLDDNSPLAGQSSTPLEHRDVERWYFQRRQLGIAASAVFIAADEKAALLGISEQLVGSPWTDSGPFQYAGSIGPLNSINAPIADSIVDEITRIGNALAAEFHLTGLFGVDGIYDGGHFWPVEVNPRYTASCEVIERLSEVNAITAHVAACKLGELPTTSVASQPLRAAGKLIVFATRQAVFGTDAATWVRACNGYATLPRVADIPAIGTQFAAGQPVVTVLAEGNETCQVREQLTRMANELRAGLS